MTDKSGIVNMTELMLHPGDMCGCGRRGAAVFGWDFRHNGVLKTTVRIKCKVCAPPFIKKHQDRLELAV